MDMYQKVKSIRGHMAHGEKNVDIVFSDVSFSYNNEPPILINANFSLNSGNVIVFVGKNGTGKTTILRLIAGALKPISGEILPSNESLLMAFSSADSSDLNPYLKCSNIIEMISENFDYSLLSNILGFIGLERENRKRIWQLSSGQRKKLSLVRAFLMGRDIILLDEPETHLDFESRYRVSKLIRELKSTATVVFVSHDIDFINSCDCDKFYLIGSTNTDGNSNTIKEINEVLSLRKLESILTEVKNGKEL